MIFIIVLSLIFFMTILSSLLFFLLCVNGASVFPSLYPNYVLKLKNMMPFRHFVLFYYGSLPQNSEGWRFGALMLLNVKKHMLVLKYRSEGMVPRLSIFFCIGFCITDKEIKKSAKTMWLIRNNWKQWFTDKCKDKYGFSSSFIQGP